MPKIRLLLCKDFPLPRSPPGLRGRSTRDDTALGNAVEKHQYRNGERHFCRLYPIDGVDEDRWHRSASTRREVLRKVWQPEGATGFEPWVYDTMNTPQAARGEVRML